jgi:hypothetical protein
MEGSGIVHREQAVTVRRSMCNLWFVKLEPGTSKQGTCNAGRQAAKLRSRQFSPAGQLVAGQASIM